MTGLKPGYEGYITVNYVSTEIVWINSHFECIVRGCYIYEICLELSVKWITTSQFAYSVSFTFLKNNYWLYSAHCAFHTCDSFILQLGVCIS